MTRAVLFAMATVARRDGLRASSLRAHGSRVSGSCRARFSRDVMPITSRRRMELSPFFVILPNRSLPPLDRFNGVRPSQAANSRPLLYCEPSPIVAAIAEAVTGPTPGIDRSRQAHASFLECVSMSCA